MRISTLVLSLAMTGIVASPLAFADDAVVQQQDAVNRAVLQAARTQISADRQQVVTLSLPLTAPESDAFWPLYREYHSKISGLNDRFYQLVMNYAKSYPDVSNEQAAKFLKEYNDIDEDRVDLREKYAKKFLKVLPATKVARYLQIEHRLDTLEALDASSQIPLVQPQATPAPAKP
ncbi:MAG TPA: hypothetical protein VF050_04650 [Moraxellaceae bacterium]